MKGKVEEHRQDARHLAARAVMAYRAGFPIETLTIAEQAGSRSGIICNWKQLRGTCQSDEKLLLRGFAYVFIGTIIDQDSGEPMSDGLRKELVSDMSSAAEARETTVQWHLAPNLSETNSFAHAGYKLASRVLRNDGSLIELLADELSASETMNGEQLNSWFEKHASRLVLDELEASWLF